MKNAVSIWINSTLQARMADPVKAATVTPNAAVADNIVKQKTGEIIDKKSGQGAKRLLDFPMVLGFIVYFFMAFPLNQMVGNMIRVGPRLPADTLMTGQDGGKYGVWER